MRSSVLAEFQRLLTKLDDTRLRMELLLTDGRILARDVNSVYESLFLRAVVGFERFCEELFFGILYGVIRYPKRTAITSRVAHCPRGTLRDIVFQGDDYLDWMPYPHTVNRAKLYLKGGQPFARPDDGERSILKTILVIRHAIAHRSDHSGREFRDKVIGSQLLLPTERSPAGFLRSRITSPPIRTRVEVYVGSLASIAAKLYGTPIR